MRPPVARRARRAPTRLALALLLLGASLAPADIVPEEALVIAGVARTGRQPIPTDLVQAMLARGAFEAPVPGQTLTLADGSTRAWEVLKSSGEGVFEGQGFRNGWACISIPSPDDRVVVLEASGHGAVYAGGEPRVGDPYANGYARLPVRLRPGDNGLWFAAGRGNLRVRLIDAPGPVYLDPADATLPDAIIGSDGALFGAIVVTNATDRPVRGLAIEAATMGGGAAMRTEVPPLVPLGVRKVRVDLPRPGGVEGASSEYELRLVDPLRDPEVIHSVRVSLRRREPTQPHRRTFISSIDGSVQYYAVNPASNPGPGRALVLSVHGASVEAMGQADAYAPKPWCHIVAPTNRRPYGFDWEDWGRLDALEVLEHASAALATDPSRTCLTGHSMGGHGTWHLGVTFPDLFAAVGPSAGWVSFWTYSAGARPAPADAVEELLQRAAAPSDTLALAPNLRGRGVHILHGDADDNVPVAQARAMRDELTRLGIPFEYHEQPGAGHWWDASDEPGTSCVDWAPMFDLFARRRLPEPGERRHVEFVTVWPGVSATSGWATIERQARALAPSRIDIQCDPHQHRFTGTTENVALLRLDLSHLTPAPSVRIELDGSALEVPWPAGEHGTPSAWLARSPDGWRQAPPPDPRQKGPRRAGLFKDAFRHRAVLVYGTAGTPDENAWALAKARFDAETFWYRGNGAFEVVADSDFDPAAHPDRNLILYGNADTNRLWGSLLADSPVRIARSVVRAGDREWSGEGLACLLIRPRDGSAIASIGVVAPAGMAGARTLDRLPYFVSGVAYPDCTILSDRCLTEGPAGVLGAGMFGPDWSMETGEFALRP